MKKTVKLEIEAGKYVLCSTLTTEIKGRTYSKTYEQGRNKEKQNEALIKSLLLGLRHLTESTILELHIPAGYLASSLTALNKWSENGFKNAKGKSIKYKNLWQQVTEELKKHETRIITSKEGD